MMFLFLIISRGKSLGETATDPYPRWQLCSLKAFLKSSVKENYFISDSRLPCPKPTFQCRGKEPEHKWAELPWAISKELKPSPAFKFFSLCPCGNQEQKEKSRSTLYAEKKSYWISKNIFCIDRKKSQFWRIHVFSVGLILHYTCRLWLSHEQQENPSPT